MKNKKLYFDFGPSRGRAVVDVLMPQEATAKLRRKINLLEDWNAFKGLVLPLGSK